MKILDIIISLAKAFFVGGLFCLLAQILIDKTALTPARILVGYVTAGVVLSALGLYRPIVEFAGAGAMVPLTGFGHVIAEGVRQAVEERGLIGALTGGLTASSAGIAAAICFGYITALFARGNPK